MFSGLWNAGKSLLSNFAPSIGNMLTGAGGAAAGGAGGGSLLGNLISTALPMVTSMLMPQAPQQGGMQMPPWMQQGYNQFMPQGMNTTFGGIGQNLQNMAGNAINSFLGPMAQQSGLGQALAGAGSQFLQNRFGQYMPQGFAQMSPMQAGQQAAQYGMNQFQQRMPSFGGPGPSFMDQASNAYNQYMPQEFRPAMQTMGNAFGNYAQNRFGGMPYQGMGAPQMYAHGGKVGLRETIEMMPVTH